MADIEGGYDRPMFGNNRSINPVYHFVQMCTYKTMSFFDSGISNIFRLNLYIYWLIVGRYPKFIETYKGVRYLEESNEIIMNRRRIAEQEKEIERLKKENGTLESEKQDALRRLSEVISVRLRDNNPNIVDLNDRCRPTKLAEMFSELYDNEWTSAFSVLEGPVGDKSAIAILLDIVMQAYDFCEEKVAVPWNIVSTWFLDMNLPGAQQTSKWLKDSRKANIRIKVPEVTNEFEEETLNRYQENKVAECIEIKRYRTKCIELCLLMVTTDPPVVPLCPGWSAEIRTLNHSNIFKPLVGKAADNNDKEKERHEQEVLKDEGEPKTDKPEGEVEQELLKDEGEPKNKPEGKDEQELLEDKGEPNDTPEGQDAQKLLKDEVESKKDKQEGEDEQQLLEDDGEPKDKPEREYDEKLLEDEVEPKDKSEGEDEQVLLDDESEAKKDKREKELFDKDLYKEYTIRGQYLDYVVWPTLFLHLDGPIISKGIAQGSVQQTRESDNA